MLFYDLLYLLLGVLGAPAIGYLLLARPRVRDGLLERLGFGLPTRPGARPCVWIHGVSVGELLGARPLVAELRERLPGVDFAISTTTGSGFRVAKRHYGEHLLLRYPIDLGFAVRRAFKAVRPDMVVLVEGEIWPNFLLQCRRRRVPVLLVNGRMTERSFRGYRRVAWLLRPALAAIRWWCAQGPEYRERYLRLGVAPERVLETGSLKYDALLSPEDVEDAACRYREAFGLGNAPVLLAGSTHEGEERAVLAAYLRLRERTPSLRLVIVPRHLERVGEVEREVAEHGLRSIRKTEIDAGRRVVVSEGDLPPVIIVDTLGELGRLYAVASVAFVGGSLVPRGGQNLLEPAGLGKPVVVGPHTFNFRSSVEALLEARALTQVDGEDALAQALEALVSDPVLRQRQGERARVLVERLRGAAARTADVVVAEFARLRLGCGETEAGRRRAVSGQVVGSRLRGEALGS